MSEHIRGSYDDALYKSTYTYTLLYFTNNHRLIALLSTFYISCRCIMFKPPMENSIKMGDLNCIFLPYKVTSAFKN